jgi:[ribosomal protein S5]-alanine N-acetyltransferase
MHLRIGDNVIRNWMVDDGPALLKWADNPKIAANLRDGFPSPYTAVDAEEFLHNATGKMSQDFFAIANANEAIGAIGLMRGEDVHRFTAELGYWLAEPFWGKGIISAAVVTLVDFAFETLDYYRIFAEPYAHNAASARVLEKAGFQFEGRMRAHVFKNGQVLDQLVYARVKEGL